MSSITKVSDVSTAYRIHMIKNESCFSGSKSAQSLFSMSSIYQNKQNSDCIFCHKTQIEKMNKCSGETTKNINHIITNKVLYEKYSSSQNYYYTKDLNEILSNNRSGSMIRLKDINCFDENEEFLKRFYISSEYSNKIKILSEYYKFHKDIPRVFQLPVSNILNKFYDRKRRVEFNKITKLLKDSDSQKLGDEYLKSKEIDCNEFNPAALCRLQQYQAKLNSNHYFIDHLGPKKNDPKQKQLKDISCSNTIQELHNRLGDICSSSRIVDLNFEENENEAVANLNNFLKFLKNNDPEFAINKINAQDSLSQKRTQLKANTINKNTYSLGIKQKKSLIFEEENFKVALDLHQQPNPVHSPTGEKISKQNGMINKNQPQKNVQPNTIQKNKESSSKTSTGLFTRKISLDENFGTKHIRLHSENLCDVLIKVNPPKPGTKNSSNFNNKFQVNDNIDQPEGKSRAQSPNVETNQFLSKKSNKRVASNQIPVSVCQNPGISMQNNSKQVLNSAGKQKAHDGKDLEILKQYSQMKNEITAIQTTQNLHQDKILGINKKKMSQPIIRGDTLNNDTSGKGTLTASMVSVNSKNNGKINNNNKVYQNSIPRSESSKDVGLLKINMQEKSPTIQQVPILDTKKFTQPLPVQSNASSQFLLNANKMQKSQLLKNSIQIQNVGSKLFNQNARSGVLKTQTQQPKIKLLEGSKNMKDPVCSTNSHTNTTEKSVEYKKSFGQNKGTSKMYTFLNERSNSTTNDPGLIYSSRVPSEYKPSIIFIITSHQKIFLLPDLQNEEKKEIINFFDVARKSANNIYNHIEMNNYLKDKDTPKKNKINNVGNVAKDKPEYQNGQNSNDFDSKALFKQSNVKQSNNKINIGKNGNKKQIQRTALEKEFLLQAHQIMILKRTKGRVTQIFKSQKELGKMVLRAASVKRSIQQETQKILLKKLLLFPEDTKNKQ